MIGFIYFYEDGNVIENMGKDMTFWNTIKVSGSFDLQICIDVTTAKFSHTNSGYQQYNTLQEAQAANQGYRYVYLIPEHRIPGSPTWTGLPKHYPSLAHKYTKLTEYMHPIDNVIYVVGSNSTGTGALIAYELDLSGDNELLHINIEGINTPITLWSNDALQRVVNDRLMKLA